MNIIEGLVLLVLALFLIGLVFAVTEEKKNRERRRRGEAEPPAYSSRAMISQRVPSVTETLRRRQGENARGKGARNRKGR